MDVQLSRIWVQLGALMRITGLSTPQVIAGAQPEKLRFTFELIFFHLASAHSRKVLQTKGPDYRFFGSPAKGNKRTFR